MIHHYLNSYFTYIHTCSLTYFLLYPHTEPWDYPIFLVVGAYMGYQYENLEKRLTAAVNEKRAQIDQPPLELGGFLNLTSSQQSKSE